MINLEGIQNVQRRIAEIQNQFAELQKMPMVNGDFSSRLRQEIEKMQNAGKVDNSQKANKSQQNKQDKENDDASSLVRTDKATGALVPPVINGENSAPAATDSTAKNMTSTDEVSRMLNDAAQKYGVDNRLVDAIAQVESGKNQKAVSPAGAIGVMQLMPDTAAELGVNPYNIKENIDGGAKALRGLLDSFGGDVKKAIAAYNAGPNAVRKYGGVPPYAETQNYVNKVLDLYQ